MEIFILVTDHRIEVVLAEIAVPGKELLRVHDGTALFPQHHTASGGTTAGLMVHVTEVACGILLHGEIPVELKAVRKVHFRENLRGPGLVVEGGLVGLGLPEEVTVEVGTDSLVVSERRVSRAGREDLVAIGVQLHISILAIIIDRDDRRIHLDVVHCVTGGSTGATVLPTGSHRAGGGVGVGNVCTNLEPIGDHGVNVDTAAVTLEA